MYFCFGLWRDTSPHILLKHDKGIQPKPNPFQAAREIVVEMVQGECGIASNESNRRAYSYASAWRAAAASVRAPRWRAVLPVFVQQAVTSTALGSAWPAPPHASPSQGPELGRSLDLAKAGKWVRK